MTIWWFNRMQSYTNYDPESTTMRSLTPGAQSTPQPADVRADQPLSES
jgi:hypothetical protein